VPSDVFDWLTATFGGAHGCTNENNNSASSKSECDYMNDGNGNNTQDGAVEAGTSHLSAVGDTFTSGDGASATVAADASSACQQQATKKASPQREQHPRGPLGLTPAGFLKAYAYMYTTSGGDPSTVWRDLRFLGYDVRPNRYEKE